MMADLYRDACWNKDPEISISENTRLLNMPQYEILKQHRDPPTFCVIAIQCDFVTHLACLSPKTSMNERIIFWSIIGESTVPLLCYLYALRSKASKSKTESKTEVDLKLLPDYSRQVVDKLVLVNGGAAISLIALMGHLYSSDHRAQQADDVTPFAVLSIWAFSMGVAHAILAAVFAYHALVRDNSATCKPHRNWHLRNCAWAVSTVCFLIGSGTIAFGFFVLM